MTPKIKLIIYTPFSTFFLAVGLSNHGLLSLIFLILGVSIAALALAVQLKNHRGHGITNLRANIWAAVFLVFGIIGVSAFWSERQPSPKPLVEKYSVQLNTSDSPDLHLWLTNDFLRFKSPPAGVKMNGYLIIPATSTNSIPSLKFTLFNESRTEIKHSVFVVDIGTEIGFDAPYWNAWSRQSDDQAQTADIEFAVEQLTPGIGQELPDIALKTQDLTHFGRLMIQIIPPDRQDSFLGFWVRFSQVPEKGVHPIIVCGTNGVVKVTLKPRK